MVNATASSNTEIENEARKLTQEEREMFIYMAKKHPEKPITQFEGMFHHLNFDWRTHRKETGLLNPYVLIEILDGEDEKAIDFMAQYLRAVVGKYDQELLDAALVNLNLREESRDTSIKGCIERSKGDGGSLERRDRMQNRLKEVLEKLENVQQRYEANDDMIDSYNKETQDLLHEIELISFNAAQISQWAKRIRNIRRIRRELKDDNQRLKPLLRLKNDQSFMKELKICVQELENVHSKMESRTYTPRVRTAMEDAFLKAKDS